jgi:hypothetical protein
MSRFPISVRILIAAVTAMVIFAAVCFASVPDAAVFAAKGVFKLAGAYNDPTARTYASHTQDRTAGSPSSAIRRHAKGRELRSPETY